MALDNLGNQVIDTASNGVIDIYGLVLNYLYIIAIVSLSIIALFIFIRALKRYTEYGGDGERKGAYTLHVMDNTHVTGNLSIDAFFTEDMLDKLKIVEKEFSVTFDAFRKLISTGVIQIYNFRITDHSKAWTLTNARDMIIIATGKIESEVYSWQDQKGRFSLTGAGFKEYPRNVMGYSGSKIHSITDAFGKEVDVLYLELIPRTQGQSIHEAMRTGRQIPIEVNRVGATEGIAECVAKLPVIIKMYKKMDVDAQELKSTNDLLDKKDKELASKNAKLNKARHLLNQKIFVGYGKPQTLSAKLPEYAWIASAFWLGALSYSEIPKQFPQFAPWMAGFAVFIIVLAVRAYMERSKPIDKQIEDSGGEQSV